MKILNTTSGFITLVLLALALVSCKREEAVRLDKEIHFAVTAPKATIKGAKQASLGEPHSLVVTIKNDAGDVVVDRKTLTLYKLGEGHLSIPLTLSSSDACHYNLVEFAVLNKDNQLIYITPKKRSAFAHLVSDPLEIPFSIDNDSTTTIESEVIAVNELSNADDYGYEHLEFPIIKSVNAIFSAFVAGSNDLEFTDAKVRIEALKEIHSQDHTASWHFETSLEPKANILALKASPFYRVTITKVGYKEWLHTMPLSLQSRVDAVLEEAGVRQDKEQFLQFIAYGKTGTQIPRRPHGSRDSIPLSDTSWLNDKLYRSIDSMLPF